VENCQFGVFLSYVTAAGHTLIDRELYLPLSWTNDRKRCQTAGIPDSVRFQTKCELAVQMLERVWAAQIPFAWVVADSVYGGNLDLRTWLEQHQRSYVLAIACDEPVGIRTADGQRHQVQVREVEALMLADQGWQRLSMSEGTKGPRLFDWAVVPILQQWEQDGRHWLLLRRSLTDPRDIAYYFVFAEPATTLLEMVKAIGQRWPIGLTQVGTAEIRAYRQVRSPPRVPRLHSLFEDIEMFLICHRVSFSSLSSLHSGGKLSLRRKH
jgi:SRSO17 transposase